MYGNELVGEEVVLVLFGKFDVNLIWIELVFEKMNIMVLFRYNLDGVVYF